MTQQDKLNKAFELKKQAYALEVEVSTELKIEFRKLLQANKLDEARELLRELEWHESIEKFNLLRILRIHEKNLN